VRPLIVLRLRGADGVEGFGEAAPLPGYDGVNAGQVRAALDACRPLLSASDGRDRDRLLACCAAVAPLPQALAAIDLALWDLAGRRAGEPVWRLLGAAAAAPVEVNATIGALDPAGAARAAGGARAAGFRTVKLKVGAGDDGGRVAAARAAAGETMRIRIDANGAWSVPAAIAALSALAPYGIECCEEPAHGLEAIAAVAGASSVPVSLDESGAAPGALARRVCAAICLKVSRCGGITGLMRDGALARAAGYELYLASTLDGPLGIAAALHAAAALGVQRPCGLATLALFEDRADPLPPRDSVIALPPGPGLGLGDGLSFWYAR
jgi:L-alanine-DL-glutamate epimerase-like enolase superfamily enzyme